MISGFTLKVGDTEYRQRGLEEFTVITAAYFDSSPLGRLVFETPLTLVDFATEDSILQLGFEYSDGVFYDEAASFIVSFRQVDQTAGKVRYFCEPAAQAASFKVFNHPLLEEWLGGTTLTCTLKALVEDAFPSTARWLRVDEDSEDVEVSINLPLHPTWGDVFRALAQYGLFKYTPEVFTEVATEMLRLVLYSTEVHPSEDFSGAGRITVKPTPLGTHTTSFVENQALYTNGTSFTYYEDSINGFTNYSSSSSPQPTLTDRDFQGIATPHQTSEAEAIAYQAATETRPGTNDKALTWQRFSNIVVALNYSASDFEIPGRGAVGKKVAVEAGRLANDGSAKVLLSGLSIANTDKGFKGKLYLNSPVPSEEAQPLTDIYARGRNPHLFT